MAAPTSLRDTRVIRFSPGGLSDSLDSTDEFPGACSVLANLIPDLSTRNVWTCRPAAYQLQSLVTLTSGVGGGTQMITVSAITALKIIGGVAYGFASAVSSSTGALGGHDIPFVVLGGVGLGVPWNVLSTNTPVTVSESTYPPTIDQVGGLIYFTHPGFPAATVGWIDASFVQFFGNASRYMIWNSGNLPTLAGGIKAAVPAGGYASSPLNDTLSFGLVNVTITGGGGTGAGAQVGVLSGTNGIIGLSVMIPNTSGAYVVGDTFTAGGAGCTVTAITTGATSFPANSQVIWVRQFGQRAYFGVYSSQPAFSSAVFTDILFRDCTNANQVFVFGDTILPTIAAGPLGLNNQLGGVIQSLMVFKSNNIYQITGDAALNTLSLNTLNVALGTIAPRSVVPTPNGLAFLAPDGYRIIDFNGNVGNPIGASGKGVVVPLVGNGPNNSLAVAACNGEVLRVSILNALAGNQWQEFWYDLVREVWSGPHSCPAAVIDANGATFVMAPLAAPTSLYQSDIFPSATSIYLEFGTSLSWTMQSSILPDNEQMCQSELAELQIRTTASTGTPLMTVNIVDESGSSNGLTQYVFNAPATWGSANWGSFTWGATRAGLSSRRIDFPYPVVFNRMGLSVSGLSSAGFKIGDSYLRQRSLGYMQELP